MKTDSSRRLKSDSFGGSLCNHDDLLAPITILEQALKAQTGKNVILVAFST